MANMNMMDVELPSIDIDYDYMLELLITGEFKEHVRGEHWVTVVGSSWQ